MNPSRKIQNDTLEAELNATRVKLYEQTKNMTAQERVDFFDKGAREILKAQGIDAKFVEAPPPKMPPTAQP
jgi:hypothetical protein